MITKRASTILMIGSVIAPIIGHGQSTNAGLNIDLRATSVIGNGGLIDSKHVLWGPGIVVNFDIFAVVTGTNTTLADDKFISVSGSLRSSNGGILGNLFADLVRSTTDSDGIILSAGFDGNGSSVGMQQDLDADTDLDVGSNNDSNASNFWAALYALAPASIPAGSTNPTVGGRRIGFGSFTVTSFGAQTLLNFDGRNAFTAANYIQDGQVMQEPSVDGLVPITILIPEPATLGWAGPAGFALLRRRRGADMTTATINR